MRYIILSELVGEVGAEFIPGEGINIDALIEGGFIKADKPAKAKDPIED